MTTEEAFRVPPLFTVRSPVDLIAAVPYLVGFHPDHSLIVLGVDTATGSVGLAVGCDPGTGGLAGLVDRLCGSFVHEGCARALIVGYGSDAQITPCVKALQARLAHLGVDVAEALRVADGRYWSYTCRDLECCPAEGVRYDVHRSAIPAAAVAAGLRVRADRAEVLAFTEPVTGMERAEMERATRAAEARRARLRASEGSSFTAEGIRTVRTVVAAALDGVFPDPGTVAWLGVLLTELRARDEAWAWISREHVAAHVGLWSHVLRRVAPEFAAAPASLLAFAAWQNEDPLLAETALDRAVESEPGYSMALLIRQALRYGVPPRRWRGFSPEWLAAESPVDGAGP